MAFGSFLILRRLPKGYRAIPYLIESMRILDRWQEILLKLKNLWSKIANLRPNNPIQQKSEAAASLDHHLCLEGKGDFPGPVN
jgi:hypothetical protein